MNAEILFPLIGYCLHFLLARATITQFLWSRYPPWFDAWATCAACSGTWTTALAGFLGVGNPTATFIGYTAHELTYWLIIALWGMFWVPILAWIHVKALTTIDGDSHGGRNE